MHKPVRLIHESLPKLRVGISGNRIDIVVILVNEYGNIDSVSEPRAVRVGRRVAHLSSWVLVVIPIKPFLIKLPAEIILIVCFLIVCVIGSLLFFDVLGELDYIHQLGVAVARIFHILM